MWNGVYTRWNPVPEFEGARLYCEAVHDDWEGIRIWLRSEDPTKAPIIVRWPRPSVLLYLNTNESCRIAPIEPPQNLKFPHAFWLVQDSELVRLFDHSSCGIYAGWRIMHYAFLACDDCIDVLCVQEPTFAWEPT